MNKLRELCEKNSVILCGKKDVLTPECTEQMAWSDTENFDEGIGKIGKYVKALATH